MIGGWEKGIATSPHTGIGDIKALNVTSFPEEVMVSYNRIKQSQTSTSGTITFDAANVITHNGLDILNGTVITISGSSDGTIVNGDYWCTRVSATTFKLSTTVDNFLAPTFVTAAGSTTASFVTVNMSAPNSYAFTNSHLFPNNQYFVMDSNGRVWYSAPSVFTGWTLLENSTSVGTSGLFCYGSYLFRCETGTTNALRYKPIGTFGTTWTAFRDLNYDVVGGYVHPCLTSHNNVAYIGDGSYVDSLATVPGSTFDPTSSGTYTWISKALLLPVTDVAISIAEIANGSQTTLLIGGLTNIIYPWDGLANFYGALIYLPEYYTPQMITVNNLVYIFCGTKGNIYITNGSSVTMVMTVPDYIANTTGTNQDPYFVWGGVMYLRGRVWFSVKAPNCGGIWSFVPSINYYVQQDIGASLRCEYQNSYGTYSGYATVLFPNINLNAQNALGPQFFSGWDSGASTYGIDYSDTVAYTGGSIIDTDLIPTGTLLEKKTFSQIEYKLSAQLVAGESIAISYRQSLTDSFIDLGTAVTESSTALGGYFPATFEKGEWLQLRITLTSVTSSPSWCRLQTIFIR